MARHSRLLWSVCIGHLSNDIFASMTPVLLTFLAAGILPMSNAQIGLTVGIAQLLNALPQPLLRPPRRSQWRPSPGHAWLGATCRLVHSRGHIGD